MSIWAWLLVPALIVSVAFLPWTLLSLITVVCVLRWIVVKNWGRTQ